MRNVNVNVYEFDGYIDENSLEFYEDGDVYK